MERIAKKRCSDTVIARLTLPEHSGFKVRARSGDVPISTLLQKISATWDITTDED
jgi:hypothetical protein